MKAFEISGGNGTYLELEDGRYADTVVGDGEDLEALRTEITEHVTEPIYTQMPIGLLEEYVGLLTPPAPDGCCWLEIEQ